MAAFGPLETLADAVALRFEFTQVDRIGADLRIAGCAADAVLAAPAPWTIEPMFTGIISGIGRIRSRPLGGDAARASG